MLTAKSSGKYRDFPYAPCFHTQKTFPTIKIPSGTFQLVFLFLLGDFVGIYF